MQNSAKVVEPWYNCICIPYKHEVTKPYTNGQRFSTAACTSPWDAPITSYS